MARQERIEIVQRNLYDLRPDPKNPRRNEMAVESVANSIEQFGMVVPIVIDKDNNIIAGHTRYNALLYLESTEPVPCVIASDLDKKQLKAFQLADNKTAELATWDTAMLAVEMDALTSIFDMTDFGFEEKKQKKDTETTSSSNEVANGNVVCPRCGCEFKPDDDEEALF